MLAAPVLSFRQSFSLTDWLC